MHITFWQVFQWTAYWQLAWNLLYNLMPPRELINRKGYNTLLSVISYYGSLNLRRMITQFYGVAPSTPVDQDLPTKEKSDAGNIQKLP
jgi:hypothetical protein